MAVKIKTPAGMIDIANDVIATVVGGAATDNYGVVGMASRNPLKDGVNQILGRDSFHQGVVIRQQDNGIAVDVYIIVRRLQERARKGEVQLRGNARGNGQLCEHYGSGRARPGRLA